MRRSLSRALTMIRIHFRRESCPPSLGDIARALHVSRQRAHELVIGLERAGEITREPGKPLSIRLVDAMECVSDDDLLSDLGRITEQLERRGIPISVATVSVAPHRAFPPPLTEMELPSGRSINDILDRLQGGLVDAGEKEGPHGCCPAVSGRRAA